MPDIPKTIRLGSSGDPVPKWQGIIGVSPDGKFGKQTLITTQEWQKQRKLVPDGVVGPATWTLALGQTAMAPDAVSWLKAVGGALGKAITDPPPSAVATGTGPKAGQSHDEWAYRVAKNAMPEQSEAERQYALTVARGEGVYGLGWKGEGKGSNNWGAVQGTGPAGSFKTTDHHADGTPYTGTFKRYATPEQGYTDMARILFNGGKRGAEGAAAIKSALSKGSIKDAVFAQHANGYFELKPEKYFEAVMRNYAALSNTLGWKPVLTAAGSSSSLVIITGLVVAAAAAAWTVKRWLT